MPKRRLRKYEPIWLALKKDGYVCIQHPEDKKIRDRIIKAVIKEKDMDIELKEISPKRLWIDRGVKLTGFHLVEKRDD